MAYHHHFSDPEGPVTREDLAHVEFAVWRELNTLKNRTICLFTGTVLALGLAIWGLLVR